MRSPTLPAILLSVVALLAAACASHHDEYLIPGVSQRLSKAEAERLLVERSLVVQVPQPLDHPLRVLRAEFPTYPNSWKRRPHVAAQSVTVRFVVSPQGLVTDPEVLGEANPELRELSLRAIEAWRFGPLTAEGKPVSVRLYFSFVFRLED